MEVAARKFSTRSRKALEGVHPGLVRVVEHALELSPLDFTVVEGVRSLEKQKEYVAKGVSKTLNSRHLKQSDGYAHAVDIYPYYDRSVQVNAPMDKFRAIADAMKQSAKELGVSITWGGDWKSFVDAPHYQIEV